MAEKNNRRNKTTDALFDAILSLETREECYNFFEELQSSCWAAAPMTRSSKPWRSAPPPSAGSTAASSMVPAAIGIPLKK